ncbi:hypothetical protein I7I50_07778 [Histoplasma capsulatum G186AR]|uniref:Uncharacterized protein n=1 Tax=Ajellomyces capsulatus TaxID=5037 RepID=A0A8H7Z0T9_AJECA|nr:hypothetical protein I7I52_09149 [Histoplasma capsulatum]QSS68386.1 hypothetical protein I7I50_07778 [Histoplasma capsulatum G186AR]
MRIYPPETCVRKSRYVYLDGESTAVSAQTVRPRARPVSFRAYTEFADLSRSAGTWKVASRLAAVSKEPQRCQSARQNTS